MNKNKPSEDKSASWKYFPTINTLLRYLDRKDFVELSKCNKFYRSQLEREVLKNLDINTWIDCNKDIYLELCEDDYTKKILEFLKTDLGTKLKFAKKCTLFCDLFYENDHGFGDTFAKLLPNIKTIRYLENCNHSPCSWEQSLVTIFSHLNHLEHIEMDYNYDYCKYYITQKQIFPKSLKSLKSLIINLKNISYDYDFNMDDFGIYETIDASYVNLSTLTVISNRMLQNLSSGMPNLQEVEIRKFTRVDKPILIAFLKSNPQLRKLKFFPVDCNEILKILLSSKYLQYLSIRGLYLEEAEVNSLPSNHSIKYLEFDCSPPASLSLKIINLCKSLKKLELRYCRSITGLDLLKFEEELIF